MSTKEVVLQMNLSNTNSVKSQNHSPYRPDIDGMRALAVMSVVIYHAFPTLLPGGFIGVDIFFVISGYLITRIIIDELNNKTFSVAEFYQRRARRIFPALLVVLLSCAAFGWLALTGEELNRLGWHIFSGAAFVANLVFWAESGYFDQAGEVKPLLHLWSLGVEEQFYLLWPIILMLAFAKGLNLIILVLSVALISFSVNVYTSENFPTAAFFSPVSRFWELLCGAALAWASLKKPFTNYKILGKSCINLSMPNSVWRNALSWLGVSLIGLALLLVNEDRSFPGYWALLPVLGAVLIIGAGSECWLNSKILSSRIAVWFGLISYPLYLWHWPLLSFGHIINMDVPHRDYRIFAVLSSIILAWLTFRYIEIFFRTKKSSHAPQIWTLGLAMIIVAGLGGVLAKRDFSESHTFESIFFVREGAEHVIGSSNSWFEGAPGWLFLGNSFDNTIAKLRLASTPSSSEIANLVNIFQDIGESARSVGAEVALMIGPNKSSVYSEYLPDAAMPSSVRYVDFFLDPIRSSSGVTVYDPTLDLMSYTDDGALLYWRTDTHWNNRGAYVAYSGLARELGFRAPSVSFVQGEGRRGDLIGISGLTNFPIQSDDDWEPVWDENPILQYVGTRHGGADSFGPRVHVTNSNYLSDQYVWVVGDSFASAQRQYINATFREVEYIGHWNDVLDNLSSQLVGAARKPDLVLIIRTERSF
jgi:peptidoglycan/LPS O-acetylase OafA/YrhL